MDFESSTTKIFAEDPIFPLVSINPETKVWQCVGTGFFIQSHGGFITAKHVFYDKKGTHLPTLYAIQSVKNKERHIRPVEHIAPHPKADIAIGMLGRRRIPGQEDVKPTESPYFVLDFSQLNNGDTIMTFAFPDSKREQIGKEEFEFIFKGAWSTGSIVDFHKDGSPLVRNRCYQSNMIIDYGASGGPVLRGDFIVGINSSGMNVIEGEEPISFITPIDLILDLEVTDGGKRVSVKELVREGFIESKQSLK